MKTILVAVDLSGSINHEVLKKAICDLSKKLCPHATISFCAFDSLKIEMVELNYFFSTECGKSFGAGSTIEHVEPVFDDYDQVYIVTDGYIDYSVLNSYPDVELFLMENV